MRSAIEALECLSETNYDKYIDTVTGNDKLCNTLKLFHYYRGDIMAEYRSNRDRYIELTDEMELKLVQLEVISMVYNKKKTDLKYDELKSTFSSLSGLSYNDLEALLVKLCYPKVLQIRLDPLEAKLEVLEFGTRGIEGDEIVRRLKEIKQRILKLSLRTQIDDERVDQDQIGILVAKELNEINATIEIKTVKDEINSRKRKINLSS